MMYYRTVYLKPIILLTNVTPINSIKKPLGRGLQRYRDPLGNKREVKSLMSSRLLVLTISISLQTKQSSALS